VDGLLSVTSLWRPNG